MGRNTTTPRASISLTFGIELEFLYLWQQSRASGDGPGRSSEESSSEEPSSEEPSSEGPSSEGPSSEERSSEERSSQEQSSTERSSTEPSSTERSSEEQSLEDVRDNHRHSIRKALVRTGLAVCPVNDDHPDYSKWSVTNDSTIQLTVGDKAERPRGCKVDGAEVVSRILRYDEGASFREVNQVVDALNGLNKPSGRRRVVPNRTCGFHVHVGQGAAGYTVEEMRRMFMVVTAFERHLDQLHGVSRVEHGCYSRGPAAALMRRLKVRKMTAWLRAIRRYDVHDFPGKSCIYNFYNCGYEDPSVRTIEFRQHRGTLVPEEIRAWIDVAVSVVRFAVARSEDDIVNFCLRYTSDPDFSIHHLLCEMDVPDQSRAFYRHRLAGGVDWLDGHTVKHRPDGFITPVTELGNFIGTQAVEDTDVNLVTEVIVDKFKDKGYGRVDRRLTKQICKELWDSINRKDDVEMVDIGEDEMVDTEDEDVDMADAE